MSVPFKKTVFLVDAMAFRRARAESFLNPWARNESVELLKSKGVDAVIPFHTMLADLIDQIEVNRNYQKSDLLQVIRILKNYDFFKEPQLELFKAKRRRKK